MPISRKKKEVKPEVVIPIGHWQTKQGDFLLIEEYKRRCDKWDTYYDKVCSKPTKAYSRFIVQKDAFKEGNKEVVKELAEEARQQMEDQEWELAEPPFSDPRYK